jgi:hypothetical protein
MAGTLGAARVQLLEEVLLGVAAYLRARLGGDERMDPLPVAAEQQQRVEEAAVLVGGPFLPSSTTLCVVADLQVQQQSKRVCEMEQLDLLAVALSSTGVARRASEDGCVLCCQKQERPRIYRRRCVPRPEARLG